MNFLSMEYFATVARSRNITNAAEELHITQQTLSAHIASLEKELGCKLLVRKTPLELTYAGERFLRYAQDFNSGYRALKADFADISGNQSGRLRIGVAHTRGFVMMPPAIAAMRKEYPGVEISLVEQTNGALLDLLRKGAVDVFIGRVPGQMPGFEVQPFYSEETVMLVPKWMGVDPALSGEEALAQMEGAPFILCGPSDIVGRISRMYLKRAGLRFQEAVATSNSETMLSLCALGVGACFCPLVQVERTLSSSVLQKADLFRFKDDAKYPISFAYREGADSWSVLKRFIYIARQTAKG